MTDLAKTIAGEKNIRGNLQRATVDKSFVSSAVSLVQGELNVNDMPTIVEQADISGAFILGHPDYGILGTSKFASNFSYNIVDIANPNDTWVTRLTHKEVEYWKNVRDSTATWNTNTQLITFDTDQKITTNKIAVPATNITHATPNITVDKGSVLIELSADGGSNWQSFTNEVESEFTDQGDELKLRLTENRDLDENLIAHYKMNDNAVNQLVTDAQGDHNGTASSNTNTLTAAGKVVTSLDFAGTDKATVSNNSAFNFGGNNFSITAWVYMGSEGNQSIFSKWNAGTDEREFLFGINEDERKIWLTTTSDGLNNISVTSDGSLTLGSWYHVAIVKEGSKVTFYLNNVESGVKVVNDILYAGTGTAVIAGRTGDSSQELDGRVDDLRIYKNIVLGSDDISNIYNAGSGTEGDPGSNAQVSKMKVKYTVA